MGLFFVIQAVTISKPVMPFKIRHVFKVTSCIKTDIVMSCVTICLKWRRPYQCLTFILTIYILNGIPSYCAGHPCPGILDRGGSRISGEGVQMYKLLGARFADFISFFVKYPVKTK